MLLNCTAALYSNSINHTALAPYWTALHCTALHYVALHWDALHFTGLDWLVVCDTRQHNPTHNSHTGSLHTLHITPFHCVSQLCPGYLVRQLTPSRARQLTSVLAAMLTVCGHFLLFTYHYLITAIVFWYFEQPHKNLAMFMTLFCVSLQCYTNVIQC